MKYISIQTLLFSLTLMAAFTAVKAQESATLQFMKGMPQSQLSNPALHNDSSKVVLSLPVFSGLYVEGNSAFATHDLIRKGTGSLADSLVIDPQRFYDQLKQTNSVVQNLNLPLFYLGIRSKSSFFSFGISEKQMARLSFDRRLIAFIKDGNEPYMGQDYDLGQIHLNALYYREFALGYSNEVIKNKLSIGLKAKVLYGKMAMQTNRMNMRVNTAADATSIDLNYTMDINLSMPSQVQYDQEDYFDGFNGENADPVKYLLQNGNTGMAFDLGAVYKPMAKLTLSASIVDMGKISFKKDLTSLKYTSSYRWEGIDFSHSVDKSGEDYVNPSDLADDEMKKMEDAFKPHRRYFGSKAFDVNLPVKVYLGGTYDLNQKVSIGLLERFYKHGEFSQNAITLSGNTMINHFLSLTGSYSVIGRSASNLGFGFAIRGGAFQLYAVTDNLLAISPSRTQYANARFGINFLFGRKSAYSMN